MKQAHFNFEGEPKDFGGPIVGAAMNVVDMAFGINPGVTASEKQGFHFPRALENVATLPLVAVASGIGYIARGCIVVTPTIKRMSLMKPSAVGATVRRELTEFDSTVLKHFKRGS